ncbi:Amidase signature domain-containing protein [Mycena kentingensis (nom. inval.)]|nr:Amidase signature domain-containing protein [Mycena kentingensis (nom. inval.)]
MATPAKTASRLAFAIPEEHQDEYLELLQAIDRAAAAIMAHPPDYHPAVDLSRFPRIDAHFPAPGSTRSATGRIRGDPDGGLLAGRSVCLKDTISVAGVPQLFGTNAIESFTQLFAWPVFAFFALWAWCESLRAGIYYWWFELWLHSYWIGGDDQGGSVSVVAPYLGALKRISFQPAAHCDLVGLKPTFGLVPYTGVLSSEPALDYVGPMARTALDAAFLLEAVAGTDGIDDRQFGAPFPSAIPHYAECVLLGRERSSSGEGFASKFMDASVAKRVWEATSKLAELGAIVEEVSIPL